jgi:hypothetical protein
MLIGIVQVSCPYRKVIRENLRNLGYSMPHGNPPKFRIGTHVLFSVLLSTAAIKLVGRSVWGTRGYKNTRRREA